MKNWLWKCVLEFQWERLHINCTLRVHFHVPAKLAWTTRWQKLQATIHMEVCLNFLENKHQCWHNIEGNWNLRRGDLAVSLFHNWKLISFGRDKNDLHNYVGDDPRLSYFALRFLMVAHSFHSNTPLRLSYFVGCLFTFLECQGMKNSINWFMQHIKQMNEMTTTSQLACLRTRQMSSLSYVYPHTLHGSS